MDNCFQEERPLGGGKLQAVFSKLAAVLPPIKTGQDLANNNNNKPMSSDIIESVLADSPIPVASSWNYEPSCSVLEEKGVNTCFTIPSLIHRLEVELRLAKRTHLSCGQVLLPCGLLYRVSYDILAMAESEPCGIRGCLIYLNFESMEMCRRLGTIQCDAATTTTFELNLTLKQSQTGWHFIPQFLKNLSRSGTIVLSPAYVLSKKKLYRSNMD